MNKIEPGYVMAEKIKNRAESLAFIIYPLLAGFAFATHPHLLSLSTGQPILEKVEEFRGNGILHFGHFLMSAGVYALLIIARHMMRLLSEKRPMASLIGGGSAIFGAVILAMDKASLCFVPSAFDSVPEELYTGLLPGIEAMFSYSGYLSVLKLLPLLPIGFVILSAALINSGAVKKRYSLPFLSGSILMINPDIDIIGLAATLVLASGFIPYGIELLKQPGKSAIIRSDLSSVPDL